MKAIGRTLGLMSFAVFGKALKMTGLTISDPLLWLLFGCMVLNTIGMFMEYAFD